jgi:hypothetical protein
MSQEQIRYTNKNNDYYTENGSEIRLRHLEKENSDLLERNKNLEERLKQLEQYITTTQVQTSNNNVFRINTTNRKISNPTSTKSKRAKTPISLNIPRKSNIINTNAKNLNTSSSKIRQNYINGSNSKNNNRSNISNISNITKTNNNSSQYSSTKKTGIRSNNNSVGLNKSRLSSNIVRNKKGKGIKNDKERDEYNIKILNEMILDKKKEIENLEYELKLQEISQKGEGYLDYELNLWQKKTNTLSTYFYQQFNNIKSEAYLDKNEFQNLIHNMKKICEKNQSYEENICEEIINKQMWFINNLDNKNKDIKKRLEKMKNIFK